MALARATRVRGRTHRAGTGADFEDMATLLTAVCQHAWAGVSTCANEPICEYTCTFTYWSERVNTSALSLDVAP